MLRNLQIHAGRARASPVRIALVLLASSSLLSCSTTNAVTPETQAPTTTAADAVSVENLLRWPLEGEAGADRLNTAIDKLFVMKPLRASQFSGAGPVSLADGYVLKFAFVRKLSGNIDIGLESEPCLTPAKAIAITGAIQEHGTLDAHGSDIGKSFKATRNGMTVRMDTTPVTYQCVTTLHVHPEQEA